MATTLKVSDGDGGPKPAALQDRLKDYWRTLLFEWKKISYPDKKQLTQSTVVVFIFVMAFIAVISFYDLVVGKIFTKFILPPS